MSLASRVGNTLTQAFANAPNGNSVSVGLGRYLNQDGRPICCKIIFAGGKQLPHEDKPRNTMGGRVLGVEVFKVALRGNDYAMLETLLDYAKNALKADYAQISGFEHIEPKEGETALQLAVSFRALQ